MTALKTPSSQGEAQPPILRVITPDATDEEVAALLTVFAAMGGVVEPPMPKKSHWVTKHRSRPPALPHGPGAWRSSALPH